MTYAERWLLPDGVEDILPEQAARIESLRRRLLDLYASWGYELVIPPLIEYTDSLLIGLGADVDLMTFKVIDQLTGRTMGIRADITPQTARIDSHSLQRDGVSRLCYASHVLYTKPKSPLGTRSPLQAGVELYGESGLDADIEVISLLLASLQCAGLQKLNIDIGHVGIFEALVAASGMDDVQQSELLALLQSKAIVDLNAWLDAAQLDADISAMFKAMPSLAGSRKVLQQATQIFVHAPAEVTSALQELEAIASIIEARYPAAELYFDLSELRGYHYHTGLVFAAFAPGYGSALAKGGRYDRVGEVFGRARPATGFDVDVMALDKILDQSSTSSRAIFVAHDEAEKQWQIISDLRESGETVVCGFAGQQVTDMQLECDRQLVLEQGQYVVKPL
jgi:ATP phosphoribosyltransferase regulatory subunit